MRRRRRRCSSGQGRTLWAIAAAASLLAACSGGDRLSDAGTAPGVDAQGRPCAGHCQTDNPQRLEVADIERIIAQGVAEAKARNKPATFVVIDRVGNVLAVYQMTGAPKLLDVTTTPGERTIRGGLDNVGIVPAELGALAKALTAMYFSSEGNAFTSRTGGQVIQEHFNPGEPRTPGGALFGVQISQLPCSDVARRFDPSLPVGPGTHRSAIGFGADPGGLPLFKQGVTVGSVGVIADGVYTVDKVITDNDVEADPNGNVDEIIATAATFGFAAPRDRRADVITLEGKTARFADVDFDDLRTDPVAAPAFGTLTPADGSLKAVVGYNVAAFGDPVPPIRAGTRFGLPESGVRAATPATDGARLADADGFVVVDKNNENRFPAKAGAGPDGLTKAEVESLLAVSVELANRTRSQVRRPLGSPAGIHVTVVDINGDIVGAARTRDALVDAIDVVPQKARTALFFSKANAAARLDGVPNAEYVNQGPPRGGTNVSLAVLPDPPVLAPQIDISDYIAAFDTFNGGRDTLSDADFAYSSRALGLIARPFYPDNVDGNAPGPLSKPEGEWSIFSTGLELDVVYNAIIRHLAFVIGDLNNDGVADVTTDVGDGNCTAYPPITEVLGGGAVDPARQIPEIRNGITLFAGGFPIYRGDQLIGAIGLSGDGLEQDDFLPFLAIDQVGKELGPGSINNAPQAIRADQLSPGGFDVNLRYVICPQSPFLDSDVQEVCDGL